MITDASLPATVDEDSHSQPSIHRALPVPSHLLIPNEVSNRRFLKGVQRLVPRVKLEVMGVGSVRIMLGLMWILGIFNVLVEIVILVASTTEEPPEVGEESHTWQAVYAIEGMSRSVGTLLLFLMLLAYPQRIILHSVRSGDAPFWNQILIVVMTVAMSIVPGYSLYELVVFWMDYAKRSSPFDLNIETASVTLSFGVLALLTPYSSATITYNSIVSMIVLAFTFLFFGGVYHNQYQAAKEVDDELHPENALERDAVRAMMNNSTLSSSRKGMDDDMIDDDAEAGDHQATKHYQANAELSIKAKGCILRAFEDVSARANQCYTRYGKLTGFLPVLFQLLVAVYLVLLITLSVSLDFHPSVVPLVGIITIIRVCSINPNELIPQNYTEIVSIDGVNATVYFVVRSSVETDELGTCSPSQLNPKSFQRSFAIVVFFLLEVALFAYVARISTKTRIFLQGTSYAQNRREILGYHFFYHIAFVCWSFIILAGVLSAAINPLDMYVMERGSVRYENNSRALLIEFEIDPLFQAGVTMGTIGYGSFLSVLMIWIILLAFAYLPADSKGIKGWFKGEDILEGDEDTVVALNRDEYLILLPRENDVERLHKVQERERQAEQQLPKVFRKYKSSSRLLHGLQIPGASTAKTVSPLVAQVKANVLVLETEILLFHFMHLSYILPGTKFKKDTSAHVNLTWDEKQTLLEDPRYRLTHHVIDKVTDTHAIVFESDDRVVIAFRGSVSLTNWQTDFDASEVVCEYAKDVQPDFSDVAPGTLQRAKRVAARPPMVHGGFVKAYESVRTELTDICRDLLFNGDHANEAATSVPRFSKVLFVTGHSLGGGLAILCAMDIARQLKLPPGRIAVTTWGAPKVGTYSFVTRFNRICPCARRFCMADDIITKLPVDPFLQTVTLNGWWHCGTEILLSDSGNMLIRPTPIERFMFRRAIGTPQAHLRMSYATALMLWVVRSHPDYDPDWWVGVVTLFYKNAGKRLRRVPRNIRDKLMDSLLKAGVTYTFNNRKVRDMMVDTSDFALAATVAATSQVVEGYRNAEEEQEPDVSSMVTELLVALRLQKESDFNKTLDALFELRQRKAIFADIRKDERKKRKQEDAIEEAGEEESGIETNDGRVEGDISPIDAELH